MLHKTRLHKNVLGVSLLLFFCFFSVFFQAQNLGKPPVVNYTPKDYGKDRNVQNWTIIQNKQGLIFVGNDNGILVYDGHSWDFIPVVAGQKVISLAIDNNNKIFVGTTAHFGYLQEQANGKLKFEHLSDKLAEKDRFTDNIWRIFCDGKNVFFQSQQKLFVYDYKSIKVFTPETSYHLSVFSNNKFYIRERQVGLKVYNHGKLELVPNTPDFKEYGIFAMLPYGKGNDNNIIFTQELGLFLFNSVQKKCVPFAVKNQNLWLNAKILGAIQISEKRYAVNTALMGSIIINDSGEVIKAVNMEIGLAVNNVIAQLLDNTGNLWLGLDKGLAKVDIDSPFEIYSSENGLYGNVQDVCVYEGKTYAATSEGLMVKDEGSHQFKHVYGINDIVWHLKIRDGKLLVASDKLYQIYKEQKTILFDGAVRSIFISSKNMLLIGASDELIILDSKDKVYSDLFEITGTITGIEEDAENNDFWVTATGSIYKIHDNGSGVFKIQIFGEDNGVPSGGWSEPFKYNGKVVIGTMYGLLQASIEKDEILVFDTVDFFNKANASFSYLKDKSDNVYAIIDNFPHYYNKSSKQEVYKPFLPIDMGRENLLYVNGEDLYVALTEGLVKYNMQNDFNYSKPFKTIIRSIQTKNDSVVYAGAIVNSHDKTFTLPYNLNQLTIELASNFYKHEDKITYTYKLEGLDTAFTSYSLDRKIKLNNLHEGNYKLIVKAKNVYETEGEEVVVNFIILPPWYRTIWAYIAYLVVLVLVIYLAIKISSARLKAQNKKLEDTVKQRTKEIEHKNVELQHQNVQILHQKQEITDSINYAKRIQNAILPPLDEVKLMWKDIFIFFQPKDIVSGDFYWFYKINDSEFLIASADCTGHGVPGGFMSMVCTDKLNDAVKHTHQPGEILKMVNKSIKVSLRQSNAEGTTKDGMEIALLKVNIQTKQVLYAGANRFLWIIKNPEKNTSLDLTEIKPTKAGIAGSTDDSQIFEEHDLTFEKGDLLYMSTDGYGDQFGGTDGKKLMTKNFKSFVSSIAKMEMQAQGKELEHHINKWKHGYEQVDDILVIGLKM